MLGNCSTVRSCFGCTQGTVNCTWYDIWRSVGECQPGAQSVPLDAIRMVKWKGSGCPDGPAPTTITTNIWSTVATYYSIIITVIIILLILGLLLWWKIRRHGYWRFARDLGTALNAGFPMHDLDDGDDEVEFSRDGPVRRAEADSVTLQTTVSSAPSINQQTGQIVEELTIPEPAEIMNLEPVEAEPTTSAPSTPIQHPPNERKSTRTIKPVKRYGFDN